MSHTPPYIARRNWKGGHITIAVVEETVVEKEPLEEAVPVVLETKDQTTPHIPNVEAAISAKLEESVSKKVKESLSKEDSEETTEDLESDEMTLKEIKQLKKADLIAVAQQKGILLEDADTKAEILGKLQEVLRKDVTP